MLCNLFTCRCLQQEVKQGQRVSPPCLFQCDYTNFTMVLICKGYLSILIFALAQSTLGVV